MIIKRKYATYGELVNDSASKEVLIRILENDSKSVDIDQFLDPYDPVLVCNTDISSGLSREAINKIFEEFDKLDKLSPYDNGYSYKDVSGINTYSSRKGHAIMQIMTHSQVEMPTRIVQVIALECRNGVTKVIEPWDVGTIYL